MNKKPYQLPDTLFPLSAITVVAGHYGVGKTNFALNLAYDAQRSGKDTTLIDLDIVNPYFRSSDYKSFLEKAGIRVITPVYAGSTLDSPSLSGAIYPALEGASEASPVIIDVGGDDVGATALGRFADTIRAQTYRMIYVVNAYRNMTQTPEEAVELLREIEEQSGLKAEGVVNNSHLKSETDSAVIEASLDYAQKVTSLLGLPLIATTIPTVVMEGEALDGDEDDDAPRSSVLLSTRRLYSPYFVQVYVRTPWEL